MDRDRLLLGLAAVFAGLTVLVVIAALAVQPFLLVVAAPFAVLTYFLWYQATGRLEARTRRRQARTGERARRTTAAGPGPREGATNGHRPPQSNDGPSRAEAYRRLGLEPGADEETVKRAYRERVKEVHPDTESGDQETFKQVTRAYERLTDGDARANP
ncbi:MAG: DnaJ domain-containing protein [Haloferacaceae archaeon]